MGNRQEKPPSLRKIKREVRGSDIGPRDRVATRQSAPLVLILPAVWVVLMFAARFDLASRSPRAVVASGASLENLVEMGLFGLAGLLALDTIFRLLRRGGSGLLGSGLTMLFVFSLILVLSAAWSDTRSITFAKGAEGTAVMLVAVASAWTWTRGDRSLETDWRTIWVGYLSVIGILSAAGLVLGTSFDSGRFTFPGIHPVTTGSLLALAVAFGVSMLMEPSWNLKSAVVRVTAFGTAGFFILLLLTRTRSALFGLAAALVFLFFSWTGRSGGWRNLVGPGFMGAAIAAMLLFFDDIWLFLLRDQSTEQFSGGTGRSDLIEPAIEYFSQQPLLGHGHGAGRFLFLDQFEWATHGHNLLIELAVDLGIVGVALGTGLVVYVAVMAIRLHRTSPGHLSHSIIGWLFTSIGVWVADPGFGLVADSFVMLALVIAALTASAVGPRPRRSREASIQAIKVSNRSKNE